MTSSVPEAIELLGGARDLHSVAAVGQENMPASAGTLPAGVLREAEATRHLTIIWSARPVTRVVEVLERHGLQPMPLAPEETLEGLEHSAPPSLMLVDARLLGPRTDFLLAGVRELFPALRVCLLADAATSAAALRTALQAGMSDAADPDDPESVSRLVRREVADRSRAPAERVLAVGAHPDDVEIGCGATLLRHRRQGSAVTVLTLSRGGVGGPREKRRREAVAAAASLDADLLMADLPDTRLEHVRELVGLLEGVVAAVRPSTVYVHSGSDGHQDHRAVHDATVVAARRVVSVLCYQSPSSRNGFSPTKFVPVDTTLQAKMELLRHYRSQQSRPYLQPDLIVATARYWARQLPHARYAEPFEVLRVSESTLG